MKEQEKQGLDNREKWNMRLQRMRKNRQVRKPRESSCSCIQITEWTGTEMEIKRERGKKGRWQERKREKLEGGKEKRGVFCLGNMSCKLRKPFSKGPSTQLRDSQAFPASFGEPELRET